MHCEKEIYQRLRRKTREVKVGTVGIGGNQPIRIQSMTTSDTRNVPATIDQIVRLADAGCEIVRITVQGKKEAESCEAIKNGLIRLGYNIPLVADIHFYPPAALLVAEFVEKIRINPGNFVDRRASFKVIEYDDVSYGLELQKIEEALFPLIEKCKKFSRALRIGTNHGSLSDRIMNRFGDSPKGMVESAFEFARICRKYDYHNLIFSMKSSNPIVMRDAYRLLVSEMDLLKWDYPLHLGVTEAGEGEEGRIKSAMGIGSLLLEGIGDTIRVSLTEDPWEEIDPCKRLIRFVEKGPTRAIFPVKSYPSISQPAFSLHRDGSVFLKIDPSALLSDSFFSDLGLKLQFDRPVKQIDSVDALWLDEIPEDPISQQKIAQLTRLGIAVFSTQSLCLIQTEAIDYEWIAATHPQFIVLQPLNVQAVRDFVAQLKERNLNIAIILAFAYDCDHPDLLIQAGAEYGAILCDRLVQGICLLANIPIAERRLLSFKLLQSARMRTVKTDFISCPGCGRTLFNLQETSKRIREKTAHLPGVKIAIMGCIVNGPGEMADADFGYVGSKPGKIDLYLGKTCVQRDVDFSEADEKLIDLIKAEGKWLEPIN